MLAIYIETSAKDSLVNLTNCEEIKRVSQPDGTEQIRAYWRNATNDHKQKRRYTVLKTFTDGETSSLYLESLREQIAKVAPMLQEVRGVVTWRIPLP